MNPGILILIGFGLFVAGVMVFELIMFIVFVIRNINKKKK